MAVRPTTNPALTKLVYRMARDTAKPKTWKTQTKIVTGNKVFLTILNKKDIESIIK